MKFSLTTGCFYPDDITYPSLPTDLIEVTDAEYNAAMARANGDTLTVTDGALVIVPYAGPTLSQAQTAQIAIITTSYESAITSPVSFTNAAGTTATFPQTDQAKNYLNQILVSNAATKTWSLNFWLDVNSNSVTPFTYTDLQNLAAAMEAAETPDYTEYLTLIGQIQSATTVADVQAIVWPSSTS